MKIEREHIYSAYRKLKSFVYYNTTDLKLRNRIAEFESDPKFKYRLRSVRRVVNSKNPIRQEAFQKWLDDISFRIVPKGIDKKGTTSNDKIYQDGTFISNVTSARVHKVTNVNYFFDGPIELLLIDLLWIMFDGKLLDKQLGEECYGSRLEEALFRHNNSSPKLYRKYHELYSNWRDKGIKKAKEILTEDKESVYILGLDVKEYYYHIRLDYEKLTQSIHQMRIKKGHFEEGEDLSRKLLTCIQVIYTKFYETINPLLELTHPHAVRNSGIPIGLASSPIIANWYLRDFDESVKVALSPSYYGRYVDDILLVIPASHAPRIRTNSVTRFMDMVLVNKSILNKDEENARYEIASIKGLFFPFKRCILQYFNANHSIIGLEKFQKKLEENGSNFLMLPTEETNNPFDDVAYDLLYDGSINKFKNVKGMVENSYELAKNLAKQIILNLLTNDPPDKNISVAIQKFFKGYNAIDFHNMWERVFTLYVASNDVDSIKDFKKNIKSEINRLKYISQNGKASSTITKLLSNNLIDHLKFCEVISNALKSVKNKKVPLRNSNLIRHHYVSKPLMNYTNYKGSLLKNTIEDLDSVELDNLKIEFSPRFVNFDECLLLTKSGYLDTTGKSQFEMAKDIYYKLNGQKIEDIEINIIDTEESNRKI